MLLLIFYQKGCTKAFTVLQVYLPGDPMEEGEELTFDSSAYKMYHVVCISNYFCVVGLCLAFCKDYVYTNENQSVDIYYYKFFASILFK